MPESVWIHGHFQGTAQAGSASGASAAALPGEQRFRFGLAGGHLREARRASGPPNSANRSSPVPLQVVRVDSLWVTPDSAYVSNPTWQQVALQDVIVFDWHFLPVGDAAASSTGGLTGELWGRLDLAESELARAVKPLADRGCGPTAIAAVFGIGMAAWLGFALGPWWSLGWVGVLAFGWLLPRACVRFAPWCPWPRSAWPCVRWRACGLPWPFCGGFVILMPPSWLVVGLLWWLTARRTCVAVPLWLWLVAIVVICATFFARRLWVAIAAGCLWAILLFAFAFTATGCQHGPLLALLNHWQEHAARDVDAEALTRAVATTDAQRRIGVDEALNGPRGCGKTIYITGDLLFARNDDRLRPAAEPVLRKLAQVLERSPDAEVTFEGHADRSGEAEHNQELSERRAQNVKNWLVHHSALSESRVTTVGYGAAHPIVDDAANPGLTRFNRRVEVVVRCPAVAEAQ